MQIPEETRHLSCTGYLAGVRLCGAPITEPAWHYEYLTQKEMDTFPICPACLDVWNDPTRWEAGEGE